ncbi:PREDICTED: inactive leucine-rich repeat receptor-like serine/threonine-protein kinase At5g24100 [Tarenaya hassleriana]|uniref:inactive leucine-rich repeat receptor-like serine/threonine-protein kinase At5g24100 n=1 Tax=Tarenaya hassleriana TaxID=28532 RepID=UPI00053C8F1D|nr:PREDICTED: inactive leucine-rich repeat receptor-like serine/threonine-protein kinase At5g24100 [Tarenaya hassleriana]XP_010550531.1 PREDICTED: inactive leucine-rich repeat receptor-like serine/threonine-protein kinase At5g24100 [Tarenaya hassleriana]
MNSSLFVFSATFIISVSSVLLSPVTGDLAGDRQALLDFLNNITHSRSLVWNATTPVCATWQGVVCDRDGSRVVEVRLPGARLIGSPPPDTLSRLSELRILSLRSNGLQGPFPTDFLRLKKLNGLYLKSNRLSGPLPSDYSMWQNLTALDLSNNRFNGTIPLGLANLSSLVSLNLANNLLSGQIPDMNLPNLRELNLSNNNLSGTIPKSLQRFGNSAFSGNNLIYENAPAPAPPPGNSPTEQEKQKHGISLTKPEILGIAIGGCFMIFVLGAILMIICYTKIKRSREGDKGKVDTNAKAKASAKAKEKPPSQKEVSKSRGEDLEDLYEDNRNRVVFFEGCNLVFNLEDLLGASAELLGKGTFGVTYRAVLEDSKVVVVKRLKEVVVLKKEYKQQMEAVGNIKHENVAPLRAFVCSADEKLLVFDFYQMGSLSSLLHGKKGDQTKSPLDWQTRMRFMIGVAKGLAHIHTDHELVHGNIKSSNVFMNSNGYGCISEIGLATLTNPVHPVMARSAYYRAPEVTDTRKSTLESDVYSFGVLILEILTGKSTSVRAREGDEEEIHLLKWVNMVVNEQWTGEVFDSELLKTDSVEPKLIQVLELGLSCAARTPGKRPKMSKVAETLEDIERN